MRITINFKDQYETVYVKTPLNTFVEAFDWYLGEYVVVPTAQAVLTASGEYNTI